MSGVPQGGVLSPLMFVLYVSDLDEWLAWSTATTYADNTTTGVTRSTQVTIVLEKLVTYIHTYKQNLPFLKWLSCFKNKCQF